ncbi:DUF3047 domain-containing protein [Rubrivivax rivuli]|uniref:DUF3047 domain-containing protein n=1 Tax=Rubrivivax rivuli TaxID=1862385 RepID=A0A437RCE9_9BURK|nr:DUF3047 domain-containing protein [Rubrivivax rivuli]RVU44442.1 DUF3047 domain-containing protein [Rubrivivax rivuli]
MAAAFGLAGAAALTGPAAAQGAAPAPPLPPLVAAGKIGAGWQVANLPDQKPPPTRYSAETLGDRLVLRLEAQGSYGNLLHALPGVVAPARLAWSWRVAEPNAGTALRSKTGDDVAAKVCLSFDAPLAQVPFGERTLLRIARSRTGQDLPAATLCWVWGGPEAVGSVIDNAYSRRVRYLVLRNAPEAGERWFDESRDIAADFQRAFGAEIPTLPPLVAVLVGADADNTGGRSVAHVTALRFAAP